MTTGRYTLSSLPSSAKAFLLRSYTLENTAEYRGGGSKDLFALASGPVNAAVREDRVLWATDGGEGEDAHGFADPITWDAIHHIRPRVDKTKEEQRRRVREKAEVFTPSWLCNLQNNLIDDAVLYEGAFNSTAGPLAKEWTPTLEPVRFSEDYTWAHYVTERRLEMTCGEAPYLCSRYDTVSGLPIPVRDGEGRWQRIGLLDRKLRVVSENVTEQEDWCVAAMHALRATYGFEWQGDNLLLARLNFINTYCDYHEEVWGEPAPEAQVAEVAEIVSWNLWQMDGLKMVVPESCSADCPACREKKRGGHDGRVALIRMGEKITTFEELLPAAQFFGRKS